MPIYILEEKSNYNWITLRRSHTLRTIYIIIINRPSECRNKLARKYILPVLHGLKGLLIKFYNFREKSMSFKFHVQITKKIPDGTSLRNW
mgnify:CR=1 FL=1